jgi:phosphatidylserine/phosphatidylglycerophosphate/cardiolipin synthase-like enzyme
MNWIVSVLKYLNLLVQLTLLESEPLYDLRSLEASGKTRACLHAKCVVVDEEYSLVTSANFTEAAHERNIEAGVMLKDQSIAEALINQFETLATRKFLLPLSF